MDWRRDGHYIWGEVIHSIIYQTPIPQNISISIACSIMPHRAWIPRAVKQEMPLSPRDPTRNLPRHFGEANDDAVWGWQPGDHQPYEAERIYQTRRTATIQNSSYLPVSFPDAIWSVLRQRIISTLDTHCCLANLEQSTEGYIQQPPRTKLGSRCDLPIILVYQISEDTHIQPRSANIEYSPGRPTASSNAFLTERADIHNSYRSATESWIY